MENTTTVLDIIDSAVKIGLGAIIGGFTTILMSRINNKHSTIKAKNEKKYEILEDVIVKMDRFNKSTSLYWARTANAFQKIDKGENITNKETSIIKALEQELFENFTVISICKAKLLLIGAENASKKIIKYNDKVSEFYKMAYLKNKDCSEQKLINFKTEIQSLRQEFFQELNKEYEKN